MGTLFLQREKVIRGEGRRWVRVSVGLSVVGEGLQRMRALPKNPGLQTAPSPSRTDPTRADSPRTEPKPEVWLPEAGTPLPTKLRGRGITITTAQLGRVDWPGSVRLKGFTSSSKQMQVGHCGRPYSRSRSERSVFKTTAEAERSQETKGVRPGWHSKPPP